MRAFALLVGLVGLGACGGPQIRDPDARDASRQLPATLEVAKPRPGDPRTLKLRIWVDTATRARAGWREELTDQVDYASQFLTPLVGASLKIEAFKEWDFAGEPVPAMRALATADRGEDVAWVIGYIAPSETASVAFSELAIAEPLGTYLIIRGWAEDAETKKLVASLPDVGEAARLEVLGAHRRHKQTVVLVRTLALTLGAISEADSDSVQHVSYAPKQTGFADRNRELAQLALAARAGGGGQVAVAKALLEAIEKAPWGGWITAEQDELLARLHAVVDATASGKTAAAVPAAAAAQYDRIERLAQSGKTADALAELDILLAAYPGNAVIHQLRCSIFLRAPGVQDPATRAACGKVTELAPGDPTPHLAVGDALAQAGDLAGARAELVLAAGKIGNLPVGGPEAWRAVIAIYQRIGALTWTEEAIAAAKLDGDPVAAEVAQKRARYGVPRGMKIPPTDEAALVAAVRGALDLVYASKHAQAAQAIAAAEKRWPRAAGLAAARCDLALRTNRLPAAKAACAKALAADPKTSWALYLSAVIALREPSGTKRGIAQLEAAIAVDPELGQAWRTLAKAYARARDQVALAKLGADYAAKFGQPLPP